MKLWFDCCYWHILYICKIKSNHEDHTIVFGCRWMWPRAINKRKMIIKTIFFTWKQRFRKCWHNCVSFHGKKKKKKKTQIKYLIFSGHGLNTSYFSPLSIFASCRPYVNHCVILQHVSAIENATTVIGPHDCEFAVLKKKKKWNISSDFT